MKTTVFSAHAFEVGFLQAANAGRHDLLLIPTRLRKENAYLVKGSAAVSLFVNDDASAPVLDELAANGIQYIVLRSAGFNNVDIVHAKKRGIRVARVPAYSPNAVAEHAIALMLALNRKLIRADSRIHELNFSLDDLTGFDMNGKTAGIIGVGKIGAVVAKVLHGFGCRILGTDPYPNPELSEKYDLVYTDISTLLSTSDLITLHAPLTAETKYIIRKETIDLMKPGMMLINTGRGALVHTKDAIDGLKSGRIGYMGLDVYEDEAELFFGDHSQEILQDDILSRLLTFRNVLITGHQGFLTDTALKNIAESTVGNLDCFEKGLECRNELV